MNDQPQPPPFSLDPNRVGSDDVELPRVDEKPQEAEALSRKRDTSFEPIGVSLELTLDYWRGGFVSKQLDDPRIATTRITADQAVALKLLACSLNRQGARTANGRFVQSNPDALRYLLDQLVGQIPAELMAKLKKEAC